MKTRRTAPRWAGPWTLGFLVVAACLGPNPAFDESAGAGAGTTAQGGGSSSAGAASVTATSAPSTDDDSSSSSADPSGGPTPPTGDADALFVVGESDLQGTNDDAVTDVLSAMGFTALVLTSDEAEAEHAEGMALVVISSSSNSAMLWRKFRDVPVPLITWERFMYADLGLTGARPWEDYGVEGDTEQVLVLGEIGGGATDEHTMDVLAPAPGRIAWGVPAETAWVAATLPDDEGRPALFGYEADALGADDSPLPARRVAFPCASSDATLTMAGRGLLEDAIAWVTASG